MVALLNIFFWTFQYWSYQKMDQKRKCCKEWPSMFWKITINPFHILMWKKNKTKICKSVQYFQTYFLVFTFFTWTSVTSDFILFFKSWFFQVLKFPAMMVMMMMMMNYFCGMVEWKIVCSLFPAGTVVRDSHHHKSLICCKQDLNLSRTWVQALMNEVVQ